MYTKENIRAYQKEAILFSLYHKDAMLWMQVGLGKTMVTLTSFMERVKAGQAKKLLVFGPIKVVASVWETEARKWEYTKHLRFSSLIGDADSRTRALFRDADVYIINYEKMNWLADILVNKYIKEGKEFPFDMVVYDEITYLQNSTSLRMSGGKRDRTRGEEEIVVNYTGWERVIDKFKYRMGLTGTPLSTGYVDLHGQYLAVDGGERLGRKITHFKNAYFTHNPYDRSDNVTTVGKLWIERKIADITLKMDTKDHLDMPDLITTDYEIELPKKLMDIYKTFEKDFFAEFDSGNELEVFSQASKSNKCRQMCNGTVYLDKDRTLWENFHDLKLDALDQNIKRANGQPVLCSYVFRSDAARIMEKFKKLKPVNLTDVKPKDITKTIAKWNRGEIKLLLGHPQSMAFGLDGLQQSGSILITYGLIWSPRINQQLVGRLHRSGQSRPVTVIRLICSNTLDVAVKLSVDSGIDMAEGMKLAVDLYRKGLK